MSNDQKREKKGDNRNEKSKKQIERKKRTDGWSSDTREGPKTVARDRRLRTKSDEKRSL